MTLVGNWGNRISFCRCFKVLGNKTFLIKTDFAQYTSINGPEAVIVHNFNFGGRGGVVGPWRRASHVLRPITLPSQSQVCKFLTFQL